MFSRSVVSNSLWLYGLWPARLLCLWESFRQEYWSGLPCPPPGHLPNPGIEPRSPALQADALTSEPPGKPKTILEGPYYFYFTPGETEAKGWATLQNCTVNQWPQGLHQQSMCAPWMVSLSVFPNIVVLWIYFSKIRLTSPYQNPNVWSLREYLVMQESRSLLLHGSFSLELTSSCFLWTGCALPCCYCCLVIKSYLTLCDTMNCSLPSSSVHGISQARIMSWVAISFSRGSSWPRNRTWVSCIGRQILYIWASREAQKQMLF